MSQPSDTPETDAAWHAGRFISETMGAEFARELERQRDDARKKTADAIREKGARIEDLKRDLKALKDDMSLRLAELEEVEKQRDDFQSKLSTVHQWIERHHQDGFTDSMTYWQNLEKIGDKYSDRIDEAESQRNAARDDAERLFKYLTYVTEQGLDVGGTCLWLHKDSESAKAMLENARKALAATKP